MRKKTRGRPKKGQEKKKGPIKNYNTRQCMTTSEAVATAVSATSTKFQVDDEILKESGMKTTFKSWADRYDSDNVTPPMHGDLPVDQ